MSDALEWVRAQLSPAQPSSPSPGGVTCHDQTAYVPTYVLVSPSAAPAPAAAAGQQRRLLSHPPLAQQRRLVVEHDSALHHMLPSIAPTKDLSWSSGVPLCLYKGFFFPYERFGNLLCQLQLIGILDPAR